MILASSSDSSASKRMPLTVPAVPTGMKTGVSIWPRRVVNTPARASPDWASTVKFNDLLNDDLTWTGAVPQRDSVGSTLWADPTLPRCGTDPVQVYFLFFFLCFSTTLSGEAKKSNSSRRRFNKYRSYEKCNPGLPPDVKTTNVGGRTLACVKYCTLSLDIAGAVPPRGCAIARSKKSLSCDVGTRRLRASSALETSGRIFSTRCPVNAEIVITGAQSKNFIFSRNVRSNSTAVFVSLSFTMSHLLTARMIEQPASTA